MRSAPYPLRVLLNCLAALLFFPGGELHAQISNLNFDRLSVEQGLSFSYVSSIFQDSKGFMWFGTGTGLDKYDGYSFVVYRHDPGDSNSISDIYVSSIYEDRSGVLWMIAGGSKANKFDRVTEKFSTPFPQATVTGIFEDKSGTLWFATRGQGLLRLDAADRNFRQYNHSRLHPGSISSDTVLSFCEDRTGTLWVGTSGQLNSLDKANGDFTHYDNGPGGRVYSIHEDVAFHGEYLWIGTDVGMYRYDRALKSFRHYENREGKPGERKANDVRTVYEDRDGVLWIGTQAGLAQFDRSTGSFTNYESQDPEWSETQPVGVIHENRQGTLWSIGPGNLIGKVDRVTKKITYLADPTYPKVGVNGHSMYEDRAGTMWFGTTATGVIKIDPAKKAFTNYTSVPFDTRTLNWRTVGGILEDRSGVLWAATPMGLNKFNPAKDGTGGSFTHYTYDPKNPQSLSHPTVWPILEDHEGALWLGTLGGGLDVFDRAKKVFVHHKHDTANPQSLAQDVVTSLFEDRSGTLWIGLGDEGLDEFNRASGTFIHHKPDPNDGNSINSGRIEAIFEDRLGALWVGTFGGGLNRFDRTKGTFKHYTHDSRNLKSLSYNIVHSLLEDREGNLWVGTAAGLNRFDRETESFIALTEKDGLASGRIGGILEDARGCLWLNTGKGITKFDPRTRTVRNYDESDGVRKSQVFAPSGFKNSKGEIFFGGINGFVRFHPDSIRDNSYVPPVVITAFRKFDKIVQLDSAISEKKEISLDYGENMFSLEFAALNYTNPEKNQYAYMLEGFDKDWISSGTRRYATYTNLDPGRYTFRVKGSNNDGVWNKIGSSVAVIITPPPWKTTWAYIAYFALAAAILYSIRRYQISKLKSRHHLELIQMEANTLREVDHMKSRFFANISHEFRTPLTLILGPIQKWRERTHEQEEGDDLGIAERNAHRLLGLINQLLDLSKIEAGAMKLQAGLGNIVPFVKGIAQSFQSSVARRNVTLTVEAVAVDIELYFDHDKMEKILTNLLSNAFKFTPESGAVTVRIQSSDPAGSVEIIVRDTGIGIPEVEVPHIFDRFYQVDASQTREHEGTGIGLALTRELVELHHGTITVRSVPGKGTEFLVRLPLGRAHLKGGEIEVAQAAVRERASSHLESPVQAAPASVGVQTPDGTRPIVLVVEDNIDVRAYIRQYLAPSYQVLEAHDGREGVDKAREAIPDLIISDVMMPKMDGYELCKSLKLDERTSHVPIILLTAKAGQENKIEGLETGADDYITKPFDAKELLVRVKNLIDLRRKLRERFSAGQVLKPGEIAVTSIDNAFLKKVMGIVEARLGEEAFSVEDLAYEAGMSRSQLHRKLTALTGQSPSDFVRYMRLHRAMEMLKKNAGTVSEVAFAVGFSGVSYFTKCFREQFGALPSEVKKNMLGDPSL